MYVVLRSTRRNNVDACPSPSIESGVMLHACMLSAEADPPSLWRAIVLYVYGNC